MEKFEEDKNEKKTGGVKNIILLIFATLLGFAVGFGLTRIDFGSINKEDKNDVVEGQEQEENKVRDLNEDEKNKLLEQIGVYNEYFSEFYELKDVNIISDSDLLDFASRQIQNAWINGFTADEAEGVIKKYFNIEREIVHGDMECFAGDAINFYYDVDTRSYKRNIGNHGHGGEGGVGVAYVEYLNGEIENEKEAVVKTKLLYRRPCGDICGPSNVYYGTYQDSINGTNALLGDPNNDRDLDVTDELYQTVADKINATVFTFVKDGDGNYGLKSVTFE